MFKNQNINNIKSCRSRDNSNHHKVNDLDHLQEKPLVIKKSNILSNMLMSIILAISLIIIGCENQILDSPASPTKPNTKESFQARYQSMQADTEFNEDVILNEEAIDNGYGGNIVKKCIINSNISDFRTAPFIIDEAAIEDDIITLTLSYSGGCKSHEFDLALTTFGESFPLQVSARILHHKTNDTCDQWVTVNKSFDLSPLKEFYFETTDDRYGTILINIFDSSGSQNTNSIEYNFYLENPILPPLPPFPPISRVDSQRL